MYNNLISSYLFSIPVPGVGKPSCRVEPPIPHDQRLCDGIPRWLGGVEALKDDQHTLTFLSPGDVDRPRRKHQQVDRLVGCIRQNNIFIYSAIFRNVTGFKF